MRLRDPTLQVAIDAFLGVWVREALGDDDKVDLHTEAMGLLSILFHEFSVVNVIGEVKKVLDTIGGFV